MIMPVSFARHPLKPEQHEFDVRKGKKDSEQSTILPEKPTTVPEKSAISPEV
jgi:hypothetical protein